MSLADWVFIPIVVALLIVSAVDARRRPVLPFLAAITVLWVAWKVFRVYGVNVLSLLTG
jgi:hypothetical protein